MTNRSMIALTLAGCAVLAIAIPFFIGRQNREQAVQQKPAEQSPQTRDSVSHQRMLALLAEIVQRTPTENPVLGEVSSRMYRKQLDQLPQDGHPGKRAELSFRLAEQELQLGREDEAIELYRQAYDLLQKIRGEVPPDFVNYVTFEMGVAYMRRAESLNCCSSNTPDSCVVPIRGGGIHTDTSASNQAIECFAEVLRNSPPDSKKHYEAIWLMNIAYMTLGKYPDGVPAQYRIPEDEFRSTESFPEFPNIAKSLGLNTFSLAGGAIGDDFDNDGYLDLMISTHDVDGQIRYYRNAQNGSFAEQTKNANLSGLFGGLNLVQADYNNDGNVDVLVLRGGWWGSAGRHPKSLLRNNGDGTFTDVTFDAGLGEVHYPTQTASWADFDNDGDLDLYVGNEASPQLIAPCQLFRNNGDGTFSDIAPGAGVTNDRFAKAVIWGDYDNDRYPDIYVSNLEQENRLYHNNRDGTFTDVAKIAGVELPIVSFPAWFWDFDNDGNLDLFVSSFASDIANLAAAAMKADQQMPPLARLYRGDGKGGFVDVAESMNLRQPNTPMGSNFGDVDNDGRLDFYLGTGYPKYSGLMPSLMFRNNGEQGFVDVTMAGRLGNLQKGHAVVFGDFDNDGDQDIFEQMGGAFAGDQYYDAFYENPGFDNHWISLRLIGKQSNRSAIGARIHVVVADDTNQTRSIYRYVNSGGTFGGNPLRQSIGIGQAERIERMEVYWPKTGTTQVFRNVPIDSWIEIEEGVDQFQTRALKRLRFNSGS